MVQTPRHCSASQRQHLNSSNSSDRSGNCNSHTNEPKHHGKRFISSAALLLCTIIGLTAAVSATDALAADVTLSADSLSDLNEPPIRSHEAVAYVPRYLQHAIKLHDATSAYDDSMVAWQPSAAARHLLQATGETTCPVGCVPESSGESSGGNGGTLTAYSLASVACIIVGAIMSGLQVGFFSLDPMKLELLKLDPAARKQDKNRAIKLQPLLAKHHWLLVTLLVCNAGAMEALPIFLDELVPSYVAIVLSVTGVLFFGEIIPQALCTRDPLAIGAFFAPFIRTLMWLISPISWPVSKLLDWILGEHGQQYMLKRSELDALVDLHGAEHGGMLNMDQVNLMKGALTIHEMAVVDVMTPIAEVFKLDMNRKLDFETLHEIFTSGYSRIPCYDPSRPKHDNFVGLLIVKDLILLDPNDATPISTILNLYPRSLECLFTDCTLQECLNIFKTGRTHMALIHEVVDTEEDKDPYYKKVGIITMEDVLEAVLQTEIEDEADTARTAGQDSADDNNGTAVIKPYDEQLRGRNAVAQRYGRRPRQRYLPNMLSPQEASAIFYHLTNTCPPFRAEKCLLSDNSLKQLIARTPVVEVKINDVNIFAMSDDDAAQLNHLKHVSVEEGGRSLYKRGERSDYFTLVLDGRCEIKAGVEEWASEGARWTTLGTPAIQLISDQLVQIVQADTMKELGELKPYVPDFTAVVTQPSRLLRISRQRFVTAIRKERGVGKDDDQSDDELDSFADVPINGYNMTSDSKPSNYKRFYSLPASHPPKHRKSATVAAGMHTIPISEEPSQKTATAQPPTEGTSALARQISNSTSRDRAVEMFVKRPGTIVSPLTGLIQQPIPKMPDGQNVFNRKPSLTGRTASGRHPAAVSSRSNSSEQLLGHAPGVECAVDHRQSATTDVPANGAPTTAEEFTDLQRQVSGSHQANGTS